jgi:hypothetical protein
MPRKLKDELRRLPVKSQSRKGKRSSEDADKSLQVLTAGPLTDGSIDDGDDDQAGEADGISTVET